MMIFREAREADIIGMQFVRNAVYENRLSHPSLIQDSDYLPFIEKEGKSWICLSNSKAVGFGIVDAMNNNIWALFVIPEYESKGIGRTLHHLMLNWYFAHHSQPLWLSTAPHTYAERFYEKLGWKKVGIHGKGEIKFEMSHQEWAAFNAG